MSYLDPWFVMAEASVRDSGLSLQEYSDAMDELDRLSDQAFGYEGEVW